MRSSEAALGATIVGVGIDVADVARFDRLAGREDGRMWSHWYTAAETQECLAHRRPGLAAALRFAVKEAAYKSVGAQFAGGVRWGDVEVLGAERGWRLNVRGEVAAAAEAAGARQFHISTCVVSGRVMATVIAEGNNSLAEPLEPVPLYAQAMDDHRGQG